MARREASKRNQVTIHDNISNSEILFFYRTPTTAEIEGFSNLSIQRRGKKVKFRQAEARLKYGLKILTGIREGDFERLDNGQYVPISSDEGSPHYYPAWKEWLRENAADLVMLLGLHVFDNSAEIEIDDDEEDPGKNSTETLPR